MYKQVIFLTSIFFFIGAAINTQLCFSEMYNKEKIYHYLKSQQSQKTGLVNSFSNTSDEDLWDQASTYDQSLAVIAFLLNGDFKAAVRILDFFNKKWDGIGFSNFYNTKNGHLGIEATVHLGPNAWMAIAALQYDAITGKKTYEKLARKIVSSIVQLPHDQNGGIAMGPSDDWGAMWKEIFSAENNIDAFVVFSFFERLAATPKEQEAFEKEADGIKSFLKKKVFSKKPRIPTGPDVEWMASDVLAFSMLAFKPSEIETAFGLTSAQMFTILDDNFLIETDDISGYDFTDFWTKETFERRPMISVEWSAMIALVYLEMGDYDQQLYELSGDENLKGEIKKYLDKGRNILDNLDKKAMLHASDDLAYPYATKAWEQVFPFAPWWRTPQQGEDGRLPGSISGTCWRMFAEERFNPFRLKLKGKKI